MSFDSKGFIATLGGLLLLALLLISYRANRPTQDPDLPPAELEKLQKAFARMPITDARILVLGDSTAALNVDAVQLKNAESFAAANASPAEIYLLLKHILSSGSNPHCILAGLSFQWEQNRSSAEKLLGTLVGKEILSENDREEISQVRSSFPAPEKSKRTLLGSLQEMLAPSSQRKIIFENLPSASPSDKEFLRRTLLLSQQKGIPFIVLMLPFPDSLPPRKAAEYRLQYERMLESIGGPFRVLAPSPLPADHFASAGNLNEKGINALMPQLEGAMSMCFR